MQFALLNISPIDGRYHNQTKELSKYFSEYALIKYRIRVEIEYFIALCEIPLPQLKDFDKTQYPALKEIYTSFTPEEAMVVKEIEKTTNHDVKAVEYYIKKQLENLGLKKYSEFVHFGLTSQDINNTAIPLSIKEAMNEVYFPVLKEITEQIKQFSHEWKHISMLARTHGQPASPTTMGKEMYVFVERIEAQINLISTIPYSAKFGGATGNFNAHTVAFPQVNWVDVANHFVNHTLQLHRSQTTTQIEHYDNMAALFDALKRINTILLDLNRDMWTYISMDYFKQKIKEGEVGSSAMPHKVNPIDFENSEGNIGIANALYEHLSAKLPVSRLQRDLTDSTVLRVVGTPLSHSLIALYSLKKGLSKLLLNKQKIDEDLENNWAVVAEAIQTILRRDGFDNPYELLKNLTRKNEKINAQHLREFIDSLDVPNATKTELKKITPHNYTGTISF
ncbi:MAG: adenylosuccinate lyase [Flavobacteriales bacterium]|nr:adenylosuccinate lyase [Flavobacteriales bacterium]